MADTVGGNQERVHFAESVPQNSHRRSLLKDKAYAEIKNSLLDETFPPGTFLSERQLSSMLGMSKTPIRAALERLESEGFVAVAPQQGIVVRELSMDEIVDLFDIRLALESFVVSRLAGRLLPDQIEQLRENLDAQKGCAERNDLLSYTKLDAEFHLMFSCFLDNQEILRVMLRLQDKIHRVIIKVSQSPGRPRDSYEEHLGIMKAVSNGEGDLAAARIGEHLAYGRRFLVFR